MLCVAGVGLLGVGLTGGCSAKPAPSAPPPVEAPNSKMPAPPPAFSQHQNAADGKAALEHEGYSVQLNLTGDSSEPLSRCSISGVHGLSGNPAPANTTVYLDVACPHSNN